MPSNFHFIIFFNIFLGIFGTLEVYRGNPESPGIKPIYTFDDYIITDYSSYYYPIVGRLVYFPDVSSFVCNSPPSAPPVKDHVKWFLLTRWDSQKNPYWWEECNIKARIELASNARYTAILIQDIRSNWTNGNTCTESYDRKYVGDIYAALVPDEVGNLLQHFSDSTSFVMTVKNTSNPFYDFIGQLLKWGAISIAVLFGFIVTVVFLVLYDTTAKEMDRPRPQGDEQQPLLGEGESTVPNLNVPPERPPLEELHADDLIRGLQSLHQFLQNISQENGGADEEPAEGFLEQYPVSTWPGSEATSECTICMDEIVLNDLVRRLPCLDVFHQNCIDRWLREGGNRACPNCNLQLQV